jgi:membrane fusion protein, copper/silver efflux system
MKTLFADKGSTHKNLASRIEIWLNGCRSVFMAAAIFLLASGCRQNVQKQALNSTRQQYTCPMHPEISRERPGTCPVCGMKLVLKQGAQSTGIKMIMPENLLKPTNEYVLSSIPLTTISYKDLPLELHALGDIAYDTRYTNTISARVSGRIVKLYIKYRYGHIHQGEPLLEIYSPELNTAQQNLVFLLKNDPLNVNLVGAAKEKLLLLGMSNYQLQALIRTQQVTPTVSVLSPYTGHVHEAGNMSDEKRSPGQASTLSQSTEELPLKEGMYLQKGQPIVSVFNTDHAWAILHIYAADQSQVKTGDRVTIQPETSPDKSFNAVINFIEPFYQQDSKTVTARVYFTNTEDIPVGAQVRAVITTTIKNGAWLPEDAILSLGLNKIVFLKAGGGFKAHKIFTGIVAGNSIQVTSGLAAGDEVAANAQFLMDSESFIKITQ